MNMDPMFQSQIKDWVILLAMLSFVVWGFYLVTMAIRRKQQNAMQKALLDKFSSAHDFAEFMQSPAGQKYVMSFVDSVTSPRNSILKSVQLGIVLVFLGAGFQNGSHGNQASQLVGNIFVCVGIGFLISAVVSHFLAKKIDSRVKE